MEQFKFSLQKLLDIRQQKEDKSKQEFTEAQRVKRIVEDELNDLESKYKKHNQINNESTLIEQKIRNNYLHALNISINETNRELKKKNIILNEQREKLKVHQLERKTVEVLKDKKQEAFKAEQKRVEQVVSDELALYAFMRRMKGGE